MKKKSGVNLCDCVKESSVEHFVFSSLPCSEKLMNLKIDPFCNKSESSEYAKSLKLPMTEIFLSFYYENFENRLKPKVKNDKTIVFDLPIAHSKIPMMAAADVGGVVSEIFNNKEKHMGMCYPLIGDELTGNEIADLYSQVTGEKCKYEPMTIKEFENCTTIEGAKINSKVFQFWEKQKVYDLATCKKEFPNKLTEFKTWLEKSKFKVT